RWVSFPRTIPSPKNHHTKRRRLVPHQTPPSHESHGLVPQRPLRLPAMASSAISDLVEKGKEIMRMKEEGQFGRALQLADVLAMKHPDSPLPPSLIGAIHYDAAIRAREAAAGSEEEVADAAALAETHLRAAHHAIIQVNSVAPDNIDNHIALAGVLVELSMFREAETALRRAWDLEANPPVTTQGLHSRLGSSTRDAKDQSYERLTNRIVDHEIQKVSEVRNSHGGALNALKEARSLAKRFPVSVRARLFEALIELEYMNNLPRDLDRTKGLERLLQSANAIVETFPKSGVSASFRARLLFLLGRHDDAEAECNRALPLVDLKEDTILPASIRGDKSEFDDLLSKITTKRQMAGAGGRPCQKITVDDIATIFNVDQVSSKEEVSFPAGGHELSKSTSNIGDIAAICNVDKLSSKEKVYYPAGGHELSKSTSNIGDIAAICNVDKLSSKEKVYYPAGGHELSKSTSNIGDIAAISNVDKLSSEEKVYYPAVGRAPLKLLPLRHKTSSGTGSEDKLIGKGPSKLLKDKSRNFR
ncbi:hypothetical protein BRADI_5g23954v3, partial [Brachypodium distachyon]